MVAFLKILSVFYSFFTIKLVVNVNLMHNLLLNRRFECMIHPHICTFFFCKSFNKKGIYPVCPGINYSYHFANNIGNRTVLIIEIIIQGYSVYNMSTRVVSDLQSRAKNVMISCRVRHNCRLLTKQNAN